MPAGNIPTSLRAEPEVSQADWLRRCWPVILAIVAVYLAFGLCRALSTEPWNDEAWYASPSLSLIQHGNTATPLLETTGKFWKGIDRQTYWVMPLQFFVQVPWFNLFGFSLLSARLNAMLWGLVALLSWGLIVHRLTRDASMALLTIGLLACDYQFVSQTALGRMDALALALTAVGLLLYLELRERHLGWAIFVSQMAVVACGLTHPTPGVPAFIAMLFLTLYLDLRRIRLTHFAIASVPYFLGLAFWGWYISAAPDLFRAQFFGNVMVMNRMGGFAHPLMAVFGEMGRYAAMAGFLPGMNPLYRIKLVVVLVYAISIAGLLRSPATRRDPGIRILLWLWAAYFLCMTFYDNTKEVKYAIHILPFYDALAAVWIVHWWRRGEVRRFVAAGCAVSFALASAGGILYTSLVKDDYHRSFLPAAMFLKRTAGPRDLILASSIFGFPLGFDRNIVDDDAFTYETHKVPDFIVIGNGYRQFIEHSRTAAPEVYEYVETLLRRNYVLVYSHADYDIFERRDRRGGAGTPVLHSGSG